jgi:ubiquitin-protein ligase
LRAELIGHHSSLQLKPGTVVNVDPSSLVQRLEKELKQMSDLRMGRIGEDVILAFNEAEPSIGTGTYTPKEGEVAREYQGQAFEFMLKLPRDYP